MWLISKAYAVDESSSVEPLIFDAEYRTACGPIACYVAAKSLGKDISLDEIVSACNWHEGQTTSFRTLVAVVQGTDGLESRAVRLSPDELADYLGKRLGAVILPVRKNSDEPNHAFCAVGIEQNHLRVVDYPELETWYHLDEIRNIWDGEAILIQHSRSERLLANIAWSVLPAVCVAGLTMTCLGCYRRRYVEYRQT